MYLRVCLVSHEIVQVSSKVAAQFVFPTAINESACCSTSSPRCDVISVLNFSHFNMCVVYLIIVLISHSLIIYVVEYLFICFFYHPYIFFRSRSFVYFSIGLFVFLLLRWDFFFWYILYTIEWFAYFGDQSISDTCFTNIFSLSVAYLFSSLPVFLQWRSVFFL